MPVGACSTVSGGVSISWIGTSSWWHMPGTGRGVLKGHSAILTVALVSEPTMLLLPVLGVPIRMTWPAPWRGMAKGSTAPVAFLGDLDDVLGLADLALEVGLDLGCPLVLGDRPEHLLQGGEFLLGGFGFPVALFRFKVIWCKVCWHSRDYKQPGPNLDRPPRPQQLVPAPSPFPKGAGRSV